jgi:hypothetical protein
MFEPGQKVKYIGPGGPVTGGDLTIACGDICTIAHMGHASYGDSVVTLVEYPLPENVVWSALVFEALQPLDPLATDLINDYLTASGE